MNNYTVEVAKNTTDHEILAEILRRGNNDYVSWCAASNSNCPPEMLAEVLRRGKDDVVSHNAASNPNCPPEILSEVLRREKDDRVSWYAVKNRNCPPEALAEVLKRGKNDSVFYYAARNPNCPIPELHQRLIITNNLNNPDYAPLLPKIQQYLQKQENEQNKLLKQIKSQYNNPILQLELENE
jgi:hypothetical protein